MTIQLVLADDHQVFRQGLATLITDAGIEVVGMTGDRDQLLELLDQQRPHVAVVDLSMPGVSIPQLLATISERQIPTRILVLTGNDQPSLAEEMLQAGVAGYILKEFAFDDVLQAIRSVASGHNFVSPQLAATLLRRTDGPASSHSWTARQLEILRLVAAGDTSRRIARKLGIHIKTVDSHRHRIREKLGVHSSAEMVRVASQHGLI